MNVTGLDLSLGHTGVADAAGTVTLTTRSLGMERLVELRERVLVRVRVGEADLVAIEGYSMGTARQNSHAHALGELGGVIRLVLWEVGIPYVDIPPAVLKKYATGKGNANKGMVLEAASKRSGLDFGGDDNRADAWWLRALALDAYGEPVVKMPEVNRAALKSVTWPDLAQLMREDEPTTDDSALQELDEHRTLIRCFVADPTNPAPLRWAKAAARCEA